MNVSTARNILLEMFEKEQVEHKKQALSTGITYLGITEGTKPTARFFKKVVNGEDVYYRKNYCDNCGKALRISDNYCPSCGYKIDWSDY